MTYSVATFGSGFAVRNDEQRTVSAFDFYALESDAQIVADEMNAARDAAERIRSDIAERIRDSNARST